jgi:putative hemin transport protein
MSTNINPQLQQRYDALKAENPKLRIRNAAEALGVSELELLELQLGGHATRLEGGWQSLLQEVEQLGKVMALTRNEYAVHERKGVYHNVSFMHDGKMGVAVNPDIDLRLFMWEWEYGYAVEVPSRNRVMNSLQFFNGRGEAVHKIYLTNESDKAAYDQLVNKYRHADQTTATQVDHSPKPEKTMVPDSEIDVSAFQEEWRNLQDTHDFFPLLKKYGLQRTQALRLAPEGFTEQVPNEAVVKMLEAAAEREVPIMVFVNSPGCIQIHSGPVKKLFPMEQWFNVMDPDFNLHLNLQGVTESWVVKKPTKDGIVTGLELFDETGEMIVYFFGKRKPGIPELESWRGIINYLDLALA